MAVRQGREPWEGRARVRLGGPGARQGRVPVPHSTAPFSLGGHPRGVAGMGPGLTREGGGGGRDAAEGKGPQRRPQQPLDGRLPKRLGVVSCRLQVPLRLALGVTGTAAGHRLGAWAPSTGGGGAVPPPPSSSQTGQVIRGLR